MGPGKIRTNLTLREQSIYINNHYVYHMDPEKSTDMFLHTSADAMATIS